jgi:hypothetical protein
MGGRAAMARRFASASGSTRALTVDEPRTARSDPLIRPGARNPSSSAPTHPGPPAAAFANLLVPMPSLEDGLGRGSPEAHPEAGHSAAKDFMHMGHGQTGKTRWMIMCLLR